MQVILDSSFAHPGSAPIWGGKKGEFRDYTPGEKKGEFRDYTPPGRDASPSQVTPP